MPIDIVPILTRWDSYRKAHDAHKTLAPQLGIGGGIAAVTDQGHFGAGVLFFPADRVIIAEFLVTNPDIPMWERRICVLELAKAFQTHAIASGKSAWMMVRHRGLAKVIARAGFSSNGAVCFQGRF